uniref:Cytochrome c oxidase subunit 3 n=1 Tax=Philanthus triangulum TaxID=280486 RepID=H9A9I8_9HYME|nr:cytochrome c oxidase subunit III [Philanthus triangulum]AET62613.1 cytochrome c oxidase subunit III [Philanthus triangulum]QNV11907.1 cytochrome c oxidase subunit III [Philanthus triangulum]
MMKSKNHPFHLVTSSPWPLLTSLNIFSFFIGMVDMMSNKNFILLLMSLMNLILCMIQWWRDVIREGTFQGMHTKMVYKSLRMGMILFIISEVMFFMSFFWTYFHLALMPSIHINMMWPPKGIIMFNPYEIPMLNTLILLTSGFSLTWAHHSLIYNNLKESILSMKITILLGFYFSSLQMFEYYNAPFSMNDSAFGSIFFMGTGFHGLHIIIGTIFLITMLYRMKKNHFSMNHHLGFEAAAWYWHFVDVIWLLLFLIFYWWQTF